ncbi:MAG: hypothetical protein V4687_14170 [Bacteroidota bacterium]
MSFQGGTIFNSVIKNKMENIPNTNKKEAIVKWLRRIGIWGFLFFLAKGLVWLAVFYFAGKAVA